MFILSEVYEGQQFIKAVAGNKKALLELLNGALDQAAKKGLEYPSFFHLIKGESIERPQLEYKHLVNWTFDKTRRASFLVTFESFAECEWTVTYFPDDDKNKSFYFS